VDFKDRSLRFGLGHCSTDESSNLGKHRKSSPLVRMQIAIECVCLHSASSFEPCRGWWLAGKKSLGVAGAYLGHPCK